MKTKIFIITILIATSVKAQVNMDPHRNYSNSMINASRIERSPNVAAFMRYGNYPLNKFTGLPQISIPIYTIKEKDFVMPINLNYHAGGRKVDEIASWVGLGWNLAVGGMINREVRQYPDDYFVDFWPPYGDNQGMHHPNQYTTVTAKGYLRNVEEYGPGLFNIATGLQQGYLHNNWEENDPGDPQSWQTEDAWEAYFGEFYGSYGDYTHWKTGELANMQDAHSLAYNRHLGQGYDLQPDVFRYNFNGYSGSFLFDYESNIIQVPITDLRIEKTSDVNNYEGKLDGFKITTPDGTVYFFEAIERSTTHTSSGYDRCDGGYVNHDYDYRYTMNYKSSWLLTKVNTPLGQIINFEYEDYSTNIEVPIHKMRWEDPNLGCGELNGDGVSFSEMYENRITINTKLLKKIETPNSTINFVHSNEYREDITTSKSLSEINIYSKHTSSYIKRFSFDYDYFLTNTSSTEPNEKRLKLKSVQEYNNGKSKPPYKLYYNSQKLPELYSNHQDMFGYYNANGATHMIPQVYIYPSLTNQNRYRLNKISGYPEKTDGTGEYGAQYFIDGANRTLNATALQACMLEKIEYPTGGVTEFYYEPNDYYDDVIDENIYGGGLRISKQISKGFSSPDLTLEYSYTLEDDEDKSSGMISNLPVYAHYIPWVRIGFDIKSSNDFANASEKYRTLILRYNLNQNALEAAQGSTVGYTRTVINQGENGSEEFYYSFPLSANQDIDNTSFPGITFERSRTFNGNSYSPPFAPNPDYSFWRGLLLEKKVKNVNGNLVQQEIFEYLGIRSKPYRWRHSLDEWFEVVPAIIYNPPLRQIMSQYQALGYFSTSFAIYNPYITNCVRLTDKYVRTYDMQDASNQNFIETHIVYKYLEDNIFKKDHLYPKLKRTWNSQGEMVEEYYVYPSAVTKGNETYSGVDEESSTLSTMVSKNIINKPYEVINYKNDGSYKVLGAQLNTYKEVSIKDTEGNDKIAIMPNKLWQIHTSTPIPESTTPSTSTFTISDIDYSHDVSGFVFTKDNHYELEYIIDAYDSYGNPVQHHIINDINKSYVWGYDGEYPIIVADNISATALNTTVNSIQSNIEDFLGNTIGDMTTSSQKAAWGAFNTSLRNHASLQDTFIKTYTYKPLVGITSETDIAGKTTYYEYDNLNRLKIIRDHDGNILKKYEYHYKNQ